MKGRTVAQLLYGTGVALASAVLWWRMTTIPPGGPYGRSRGALFAAYVATRELPCNHRLAARDLVEPAELPGAFRLHLPDMQSLIGRYLRHPVERGKPVRVAALAALPLIRPVDQGQIVRVPVGEQPEVLDWLDAGSAVTIVYGDDSAPAELVFVSCGNEPENKSCVAVLVAPKTSVFKGDAAKWRLAPAAGPRHWSQQCSEQRD